MTTAPAAGYNPAGIINWHAVLDMAGGAAFVALLGAALALAAYVVLRDRLGDETPTAIRGGVFGALPAWLFGSLWAAGGFVSLGAVLWSLLASVILAPFSAAVAVLYRREDRW